MLQPAWFMLNEPPILNLPRNAEEERIKDPQYVKMEWFPRHLGSMNSSFTAQYKVELYALRVPGVDPNQAVLSLQPDYEDVTTRTFVAPSAVEEEVTIARETEERKEGAEEER